MPLVSVTAVLVPVLLSKVTETPGSTPPCSSFTVPVITPVRLCAATGTAIATRRRRRNAFFRFFMFSVSSLADGGVDLAVVVADRHRDVGRAGRHQQQRGDARRRGEEMLSAGVCGGCGLRLRL